MNVVFADMIDAAFCVFGVGEPFMVTLVIVVSFVDS